MKISSVFVYVCILLYVLRGGIIITDIFTSDIVNGSHFSLGNQSRHRIRWWCKSEQVRAISAEDFVSAV